MNTGRTCRTPRVFIEALQYIVKQCGDKDGVLCAEEVLPIYEFEYQLGSRLCLFAVQDSEILASALLDLGVITLASEQVNNYDVQVHPDRARKILNTLANWQ